MSIVKCDFCGKEIEKRKQEVKRNKHNFCSYEHYLEYIKIHKFSPEEKRLRSLESNKKSRLKFYEKRKAEVREYYKKNKEEINKKCRERYLLKNKEKFKNYRELIYKYLIKEGLLTDCIICGFPKEKTVAIEFHHIKPENKKYEISQIIKTKSKKEELIEEIKKCVCLCSNCHKLYHANDFETIKKFDEVVNDR